MLKTCCRQEDSQYEASDELLQLVACMPPFVRQPAQNHSLAKLSNVSWNTHVAHRHDFHTAAQAAAKHRTGLGCISNRAAFHTIFLSQQRLGMSVTTYVYC